MKRATVSLKAPHTNFATKCRFRLLARLVVFVAVTPVHASAGNSAPIGNVTLASHPVAPVANACSRFTAVSIVQDPPAVFSHNGELKVNLS